MTNISMSMAVLSLIIMNVNPHSLNSMNRFTKQEACEPHRSHKQHFLVIFYFVASSISILVLNYEPLSGAPKLDRGLWLALTIQNLHYLYTKHCSYSFLCWSPAGAHVFVRKARVLQFWIFNYMYKLFYNINIGISGSVVLGHTAYTNYFAIISLLKKV